MTEQEQTGCYEVAFTGEQDQPTSMDLIIYRGEKPYLVSVATPAFKGGLRQYNKGLDPSVQMGEKYFLMDAIPPADEVCGRLSQIPFAELEPYLVEQIPDPVDGEGFEPPASSM